MLQSIGNRVEENVYVGCMKIVKIEELPEEMLQSKIRRTMWENTNEEEVAQRCGPDCSAANEECKEGKMVG